MNTYQLEINKQKLLEKDDNPKPNYIRYNNLIKIIQLAISRDKFCDELDYLETIGGIDAIIEFLRVDAKLGISNKIEEINERRSLYGTNQKKKIPMKKFMRRLWEAFEDFTLRILFVAAIFSIALQTAVANNDQRPLAWIQGFAIIIAVFLAIFTDAITSRQRDKEFERINNLVDARQLITVLKNGRLEEINIEELVVGDVVKIYEGMQIPVDALIIEAHEITTDESAMTGESDPIKKNNLDYCINKRNEAFSNKKKHNNLDKHSIPSPVLISGTKVLTGDGYFICIVVGENSAIGKIRALITTDTEITPMQQKLEKIARDMGKLAAILAITTFLVLLIRFFVEMGMENTWNDSYKYVQIIDFFLLAVAVLVVSIPEGLHIAVTLALAYSVRQMMKDNNLVRRIEACEIMGGANNICSDKTGTLTQNKMTLTMVWNGRLFQINTTKSQYSLMEYVPSSHAELVTQGIACNSSATLDPPKGSRTDIALLEFLAKCSIQINSIQAVHLVGEYFRVPFTSSRKRQTTILNNVENGLSSKKRLHIKGASELILDSCKYIHYFDTNRIVPITQDLRDEINQVILGMANQSLRTIAMAYKEIHGDEDLNTVDKHGIYSIEKDNLILLGILGVRDILRPNVLEAVRQCKRAGIKVRMVTGDNKITASAIAKECGIIDLNSIVLEGNEFQELTGGVICQLCKTKECDCPRTQAEAKRSGKKIRIDIIKNGIEFDKIAQRLDVLARSRPEDKYALVTGLRERGNVVAVTGDGTNDAPALKKADVGFAMGIAGTDVAKEAAAIILLDDNFSTIVKAVIWGRNIYDSIKKFLQFQLTINISAAVITLLGAALLKQAILAVIQLLWINLIMNTLAALALAAEPPNEELLNRKPYKKDEYMVSRTMMKHIIIQGLYQILVMALIVFLGDYFIPEFLEPEPDLPQYVIYSDANDGHSYVRSGRYYEIASNIEDYLPYLEKYGPSRHFTMVFNTFVIMLACPFSHCSLLIIRAVWYMVRRESTITRAYQTYRSNVNPNISGKWEGLFKSKLFLVVILIIIILQLILGNLGGRPLNVSLHYMDYRQWFIAIAFGSGSWILAFLVKFIPSKIFPRTGLKKVDPRKDKSWIMGLRRPQNEEGIQIAFDVPFSRNEEMVGLGDIMKKAFEIPNENNNPRTLPSLSQGMKFMGSLNSISSRSMKDF